MELIKNPRKPTASISRHPAILGATVRSQAQEIARLKKQNVRLSAQLADAYKMLIFCSSSMLAVLVIMALRNISGE